MMPILNNIAYLIKDSTIANNGKRPEWILIHTGLHDIVIDEFLKLGQRPVTNVDGRLILKLEGVPLIFTPDCGNGCIFPLYQGLKLEKSNGWLNEPTSGVAIEKY